MTHKVIIFKDYPDFRPNLSPKEILQMGSFGGTYFRPIYSSITNKNYKNVYKEFPPSWFKGLDIEKQVTSSKYDKNVNKYKVKTGMSLEYWENHDWINKRDPYGWFQWYCRFYLGRRTSDDERQINRWKKIAGESGRWRNNLLNRIKENKTTLKGPEYPKIRQILQHWAYIVSKQDLKS